MPITMLNISRRWMVITLFGLAGMLAILLLFYQCFVSSLADEKKLQSQRLSDAGVGIIRQFHGLSAGGVLSDKEAQSMAMAAVQSATYGEDGYFWLNSGDGIMLMHPCRPELVGEDMLSLVDVDGKHFFVDIIETAKRGGGYVNYYWSKHNDTDSNRKNSYVKYFEPWDWVLGTGVYLDDISKDIDNHVLHSLGWVFLVTILFGLYSFCLTRKYIRQLEGMAIRDKLTSLYTRRFLDETMDDLVLKHDREGSYLSILFFDIDHFKNINDTYGHTRGDEVLAAVGRKIRKTARPDDICIRYGGEEFVVIMFSEIEEASVVLAERIREAVGEIEFTDIGIDTSVTVSAGIAVRGHLEAFNGVLKRADENMYTAKSRGRNCVVY